MPLPTPEARPARKLVWASDAVVSQIGQRVQPQVSLPTKITQVATGALVLTWLPAFIVFAVTTIVAPPLTNEAGVGTAAFWALQFAMLIAIAAVVTTVRRRTAKRNPAETDTSARGTLLRVAISALLTSASACLVLALQGLSISQIASLTVELIVVLHLMPIIVARLLQRLLRRRRASSSDPVS
ncbi:hypothetical protein [Micromonospora sp. NBC_01796]|uniref:hypothetical protein n=1 Tax=Micromonospora sp. NBC_01796 TaxID=2975987 RepID=UPI002DDA8F8C|nr:hypothetical protein [Micromonospora sp. NBC_01796]WSA84067.1 hypothetical protein OIE47_27420 [Micromonospora sp. NBC_01796]